MNDIQELLNVTKLGIGPGWWPILDEYLPEIAAFVSPDDIEVKEKYGFLRIQTYCDRETYAKVEDLIDAVELATSTTCEQCGAPGTLRTDRTLCDVCANKEQKE